MQLCIYVKTSVLIIYFMSMEHNSSRVAQTAKKFPSLFETLQVISFQHHLPAISFLRPTTHIHTLNFYFFKIHISIILPSTSMFLN